MKARINAALAALYAAQAAYAVAFREVSDAMTVLDDGDATEAVRERVRTVHLLLHETTSLLRRMR